MAINKTAKNLTVKIKNEYISFSKTLYETSEKVEIVATKENLTLYSAKKIQITGNKS
ncbi:hypothetical protein [Flavobacterium aquidurense]|uniref:Uncharacterized protein n=1 Tax=Flavobacterium aquidurense TaxID=362413 RepID=A0A0Q0S4H3_9FLAO|nr:hypothetical protein [Flavobacterium aquidurense]KQB40385.1 hypothetical protein RC62_275 [Flavobacterium aquidurense]